MVEDKLDQPQRIRLECLAQSIMFSGMKPGQESPEQIIERASRFEAYVKDGMK